MCQILTASSPLFRTCDLQYNFGRGVPKKIVYRYDIGAKHTILDIYIAKLGPRPYLRNSVFYDSLVPNIYMSLLTLSTDMCVLAIVLHMLHFGHLCDLLYYFKITLISVQYW